MTSNVPATGRESRAEAISGLRRQMAASRVRRARQRIVPTGRPELDTVLPGGGLPTASVIEWIADPPGTGVVSSALLAARGVLSRPGVMVVIDAAHDFNAVVLPALGIPLDRLLLIRPQTVAERLAVRASSDLFPEALWSLEQAARCPGVALVLCRLGRASRSVLRRLQLAVERSGVTVILIRPLSALAQPSFSDVRIRWRDGRCEVLRADPLANGEEAIDDVPVVFPDDSRDRKQPAGRRV